MKSVNICEEGREVGERVRGGRKRREREREDRERGGMEGSTWIFVQGRRVPSYATGSRHQSAVECCRSLQYCRSSLAALIAIRQRTISSRFVPIEATY